MVKDGRTIVIGGLFRESTTQNRSQVPGLGSLPVLGALFRQKADNTVREEVIILLTPHIVKDDDGYANASEEEMAAADKMRVGMRRGLMWFGRERLAEAAYERAVEEMSKPNPNQGLVMWHLNTATALNPKFLEAIELKERVSGKTVTSVDNSSIRSFVSKAVMAEQAASPAPTTAPARSVRLDEPPAPQAKDAAPATQPADNMAPATQPVTEPSVDATVKEQPAAVTPLPDVESVANDEKVTELPTQEAVPSGSDK
jgi:hypothetical protein